MKFTIGSLFDGSGGFPLAASMVGGVPVWASEIEPYPIAVTRSRFPQMRHLGDISKINGAEIEPVDVITFGSPCQDLSVAGKRAGLKHESNGDEETTRSGLFMEAVRIIKEMRAKTNGRYPTYAVWENVPGAFSSNSGEDFRTVLEELIKIVEPCAVMPAVQQKGWAYADCYVGDGWSLAYRVFDAQYWGVPQRRRRIHLVIDFAGGRAADILFEREGVRGYFAEGRTPWQGASADASGSVRADDREGGCVASAAFKAGQGIKARSIGWEDEKCPTLAAEAGGNSVPAVCVKCYAIDQQGGKGGANYAEDVMPTICSDSHGTPHAVAYTLKIRSGCDGGGKGALVQEDKRATLATNNDQYLFQPVVCYDALGNGDGDVVPTLTGDHENRITDYTAVVCEQQPVFCLQGNGIDRADTAGCNGKGWKEDQSYTLNTIDRPAVAYAETYQKTTGPLMANSHPGSYSGQDAYTDMFVVGKAKCYRQGGFADYVEGEVGTLRASGGDYGGGTENIIVQHIVRYIVRRLTPTECARLQGFADRWGDIDPREEFTDEEYAFWLDVRNTHSAINDKAVKEYTRDQMVRWYNKLRTDSAEYKMWGNGIALPPALYVMQGIADEMERRETE